MQVLVIRSLINGVLFPYDPEMAKLEKVEVLDFATMKVLPRQQEFADENGVTGRIDMNMTSARPAPTRRRSAEPLVVTEPQ